MKRLLKLVLPLSGKIRLLKYIFLGILSGLCNFFFINSVTRVIDLTISGRFMSVRKEYVIIFAAIILFFIWVRKALSLAIIHLSQTLFWTIRRQILTLVLGASYRQFLLEKTEIYSAIVNDVSILTNASMSIIDFSTSWILAISCLVYLATISIELFLITLVIAALGVGIYHYRAKRNLLNFQRARILENSFQKNFDSIMDGFKEIYMESKKGKYIADRKINDVAREAYLNNTEAFAGFLNNQITGQVLFYILISSILLFFSSALAIKASSTVSFVFTLLYLLSSIETIMVLLPGLARARIASNHLMDLKAKMERTDVNDMVAENCGFKEEFEHIGIRDLEFHYDKHDKSFGIGPINFDIQKGEVVFIYGGNGSGKTTFVHNILGLCVPSTGEIRCNGTLINNENYAEYRAMFSVVFSDFYLFEEILGVDRIDIEKWDFYLRLFELEGKVSIEGSRFTTIDLSTGQRKRLALIAALLEEKPVLVMDEWAADQDPHFRKKFYIEILPLLKQSGFTIIAITHDDRYYHCAHKLYKMDYGKLIREDIGVYETYITA